MKNLILKKWNNFSMFQNTKPEFQTLSVVDKDIPIHTQTYFLNKNNDQVLWFPGSIQNQKTEHWQTTGQKNKIASNMIVANLRIFRWREAKPTLFGELPLFRIPFFEASLAPSLCLGVGGGCSLVDFRHKSGRQNWKKFLLSATPKLIRRNF